jgi:hypothetical protein
MSSYAARQLAESDVSLPLSCEQFELRWAALIGWKRRFRIRGQKVVIILQHSPPVGGKVLKMRLMREGKWMLDTFFLEGPGWVAFVHSSWSNGRLQSGDFIFRSRHNSLL